MSRHHPGSHPLLALVPAAFLAIGCAASGSPSATRTESVPPGTSATATGTAASLTPLPPSSPAPTPSADDLWLLAVRQTLVDEGSGSVGMVVAIGPDGKVVQAPIFRPMARRSRSRATTSRHSRRRSGRRRSTAGLRVAVRLRRRGASIPRPRGVR